MTEKTMEYERNVCELIDCIGKWQKSMDWNNAQIVNALLLMIEGFVENGDKRHKAWWKSYIKKIILKE